MSNFAFQIRVMLLEKRLFCLISKKFRIFQGLVRNLIYK
jgi:hypothetical protein